MVERFSRDCTLLSLFKHPLTKEWATPVSVRSIYVESRGENAFKIQEEHYVRGDHVGRPATELNALLESGVYRPTVWTMRPSCSSKHVVIVAQKDFDIQCFRHDLMLLYAFGLLGSYSNRTAFLEEWQTPAGLLLGNLAWSEAQGWWHSTAGVIVICLERSNVRNLWEHVMSMLALGADEYVDLGDDYKLADDVLREASTMFFEEAARTPRT